MAAIPKTNIQEVVVRNTLNANGGNTDDQWSNLCGAAGKANWRARYKPVPYNVNACQDHDPNGLNYLSKWWTAFVVGDSDKSGRCGVDFPIYTSTASLQGVADPTTLWKHDYPDGGTTQPYRITDFAGYDPQAAHIISEALRQPTAGGTILIGQSTPTNIAVRFNENRGTSALDYTEIGALNSKMLNNLYYGLVAISEDGRYHSVQTMNQPISTIHSTTSGEYASATDHNMFMILDRNFITQAGQYKMYPCLFVSNEGILSSETPIAVANGYIPLPVEPITVRFEQIGGLFDFEDFEMSAPSYGGRVTLNFTLYNDWENELIVSPYRSAKITIRYSVFPRAGNPSDYPDRAYNEEVLDLFIECPANSRVSVSHETDIYLDPTERVEVQMLLRYNDSPTFAQESGYYPKL